MYAKRLQTGDANALETNKINLELLNVRTEASLNETALRNKQQELNTLNGNIPVVFEENQYPATKVLLPANRLLSINHNGYQNWNSATVGIQKQAYLSTV